MIKLNRVSLPVQVSDADTGTNGQIRSVSIVSARSTVVPDAMSYFQIRLSKLSSDGEYRLEISRPIIDIGNQVGVDWWDRILHPYVYCREREGGRAGCRVRAV